MYRICFYDSPLGPLGLTVSDEGLCGLWFAECRAFSGPHILLETPLAHPALGLTARWLDAYFAGKNPDPREIPLAPQGTPFQKLVWELLLELPWGTSTTYGALASRAAAILGRPRMSAQAIGGAVGANPIAILIPCHRCLAAGNRPGGYAHGPERKRKLLKLEGISYTDKKQR